MGIPAKAISEHLGHCNTRTTENIYVHVFAETLAPTSDASSQVLAREGRIRRTALGDTGTENTRVPAQVQKGRNFGV